MQSAARKAKLYGLWTSCGFEMTDDHRSPHSNHC